MIVLLIILGVAGGFILAGFLLGMAYFLCWVWASVWNDGDYGVKHDTDTRR